VAQTDRGVLRVEVEADIHRSRGRALTEEDLDGIAPRSANDKGYFAVALCGPYPRWLLVDHARLRRRHGTPASAAILQALADVEDSARWTDEFITLLLSDPRHLQNLTFRDLVDRALEARPL